jgi:hypothetical protein
MFIYKCMLNVYKNQQNRQTGSRNLMGPKTLPTIWNLWPNIKFQQLLRKMRRKISWTDGRTDGRTDRGKTVYPPPPLGSGGIKMTKMGKKCHNNIYKCTIMCCWVFISVTPNILDKNCEILILYFRIILTVLHSWLFTWLVVTRRVRHVEQEHLRFPWF